MLIFKNMFHPGCKNTNIFSILKNFLAAAVTCKGMQYPDACKPGVEKRLLFNILLLLHYFFIIYMVN